MTITPCECAEAGWCPRHHCDKSVTSWQFCRTNQIVFEAFEAGRGPCEPSAELVAQADSENPSFVQRALHLGQAVVRHARNGFAQVSSTVCESRLSVCRQCASCDTAAMICRDCGCSLAIKAQWDSEQCPQGRWDAIARASESNESPRS